MGLASKEVIYFFSELSFELAQFVVLTAVTLSHSPKEDISFYCQQLVFAKNWDQRNVIKQNI